MNLTEEDLPRYRMKNSHENDKWIVGQLRKIPQAQRESVKRAYSGIYKDAGNEEPVCYKKTVKASYAANVWLREYVSNGNVRKPDYVDRNRGNLR